MRCPSVSRSSAFSPQSLARCGPGRLPIRPANDADYAVALPSAAKIATVCRQAPCETARDGSISASCSDVTKSAVIPCCASSSACRRNALVSASIVPDKCRRYDDSHCRCPSHRAIEPPSAGCNSWHRRPPAARRRFGAWRDFLAAGCRLHPKKLHGRRRSCIQHADAHALTGQLSFSDRPMTPPPRIKQSSIHNGSDTRGQTQKAPDLRPFFSLAGGRRGPPIPRSRRVIASATFPGQQIGRRADRPAAGRGGSLINLKRFPAINFHNGHAAVVAGTQTGIRVDINLAHREAMAEQGQRRRTGGSRDVCTEQHQDGQRAIVKGVNATRWTPIAWSRTTRKRVAARWSVYSQCTRWASRTNRSGRQEVSCVAPLAAIFTHDSRHLPSATHRASVVAKSLLFANRATGLRIPPPIPFLIVKGSKNNALNWCNFGTCDGRLLSVRGAR